MFVTWPRYRRVTWLCGWGPLILSHHPAKFRVHRPYGIEIMTFVISVPIPIPIRGSNVEVYKWPSSVQLWLFKGVKSKSSYRRSNIWSEQTNAKDLKTQCCYKKEISYEAVKFDTDGVQIDKFSNFWLNFTEFHIIFFKILTEVALKRNFLQMKSKEKMMGNVCGGDQF